MNDEIWAQVIAAVIGALITVLFRVIDRYLPDPGDDHPLPPVPPLSDDAPPHGAQEPHDHPPGLAG